MPKELVARGGFLLLGSEAEPAGLFDGRCVRSATLQRTVTCVDDPLQKEHAALATIDAQTATAEALLSQLSAHMNQPWSQEAEEVWRQMRPLLSGLGATAADLVEPSKAVPWLRDTKLPGLAAAGVFARRNTAYKLYGDEKISDAEADAHRRQWEAEAVAAEQRGDDQVAREAWLRISAWYGKLADREDARAVEILKDPKPDLVKVKELRGHAQVHRTDARSARERGLSTLAAAAEPRPLASSDEAFELGRAAGGQLRRSLEEIDVRACNEQMMRAFL